MSKFENRRLIVVAMLVLASVLPAVAQTDKAKKKKNEPTGTPVLWHDPADLESRNLLLGAGGEAMKPDLSKVTFVEEKTGGYSKKVSSQRWGW